MPLERTWGFAFKFHNTYHIIEIEGNYDFNWEKINNWNYRSNDSSGNQDFNKCNKSEWNFKKEDQRKTFDNRTSGGSWRDTK